MMCAVMHSNSYYGSNYINLDEYCQDILARKILIK
jgi:hypothetical protein